MDHAYFMLQLIRNRPGLYIGKPSLTALRCYMSGYTDRLTTELWMKKTGLDFTEHYDYFSKSGGVVECKDYLDGFANFIFDYYNVRMTVKSGETIILENTPSEEAAFDKYYELLDLYFDEQHKKEGDAPDV